MFGLLFGYGHRPLWGFAWSVGLVLFASLFYGQVYRAGQMAPNSDVVLTSAAWLDAVGYDTACLTTPDPGYAAKLAAGCEMPLRLWERSADARDYETFSAVGYGFDLFIPLDALGQEAAWAPSKDRGGWGFVGFYLRWGIQVMGWVLTALGAAVLTGLIGRRE